MSFYKELSPFVEYIHSIRKLKNYLSFDLKFPVKWSLPKSIVEAHHILHAQTGKRFGKSDDVDDDLIYKRRPRYFDASDKF